MSPVDFEAPLLSAVIISFNEERNLPRCLASLRIGELVDEAIVVDSGSTDATVELAISAGAQVIHHPFEGHIEQKNWAQAQARGQWILSLDADEALSEELQASLRKWREAPGGATGFALNRLTNYCGKWIHHSGWYPDRKVRLWQSGKGRWEGVNPHDRLEVQGDVERMNGDLLHYSYYTRQDHLNQIQFFSDIAASAHDSGGLPVPLIAGKAAFQWLKTYLIRGGWRDGIAGWEIARWSAFATWVKYRKSRHRSRALRRLPHGRMRRVLVVRTDGIGDVVVTLPMAGWLKAASPGIAVGLCVANYTSDVASACPDVDEVVVKGAEGWVEAASKFDAVIFAFPDAEVVKALKKAIPIRVGTGRRWHMFSAVTHRLWESRKRSGRHEAWHGLRLLEPIRLVPGVARPGIALPLDDENALLSLLHLNAPASGHGLGKVQQRAVVVHPGSHGSANNWSLVRYAKLVRSLAEQGVQVFVTGTTAEGQSLGSFWEEIKSPRVVNATGRCTLTELMALLDEVDCVVAASTGPLHLAAAMGTRVVGLYGKEAPVWPERWKPIGRDVQVFTAHRLDDADGLDIEVEAVLAAALAKQPQE